MIKYAIDLYKTADGKKQVYKEILALCSMFDMTYDAGSWTTPFYIFPNSDTNLAELEQFMSECGIVFYLHAPTAVCKNCGEPIFFDGGQWTSKLYPLPMQCWTDKNVRHTI